jgi:hypothetical protein
MANLLSLCWFCAWIFNDGMFGETVRLFPVHVRSLFRWGAELSAPDFANRLAMLDVTLLVVAVSGLELFFGLFFGEARQRGLRSWLAVTGLIAVWLTLGFEWRDLQWRGQVHRARPNVAALSALANSLQQSWPTIDGEMPDLGPFQAYPIAKPDVLLLFSSKQLPGATAPISAVNRSNDGDLRFQLAGDEVGTWLELHPHDMPGDFVGGLDQKFVLDRAAAVGEKWYLVKYR